MKKLIILIITLLAFTGCANKSYPVYLRVDVFQIIDNNRILAINDLPGDYDVTVVCIVSDDFKYFNESKISDQFIKVGKYTYNLYGDKITVPVYMQFDEYLNHETI